MNLGVFFTRGISLKIWKESGLLDREKLIYEEHLKNRTFDQVYWFTYGKDDKELSQELCGLKEIHESIRIVQMPWIFNSWIGCLIYSFLMPFLQWKILKKMDILKTNQMDGSWSGIITKVLLNKKLVLRTGYTLTQLRKKATKQNWKSSLKIFLYSLIEKIGYHFADIGVVTSNHSKVYIEKRYKTKINKVRVIPNFVDSDRFYPFADIEKYSDRIIFIGRLTPIKNIFNLISAISMTNLTLDIYGDGNLKDELSKYSKKLNSKVNFKGIISNSKVPEILNQYKYFVISSLFDSMPKTLLEAMSCGLICIGTDVIGINEIIVDGKNGFLFAGTEAILLKKKIDFVTHGDFGHVGDNARKSVQKFYSIKEVIDKENRLFSELFDKGTV